MNTMFVIFSDQWDPSRAIAQERFLADTWLELLSDDASPLYWPPLCSTLQLFKNVRQILHDVDRKVLKAYHIWNSTQEILHRLEEKTWLSGQYPVELPFLKEPLTKLARTKETREDSRVRAELVRLLGAFVDKVEQEGPIHRQRTWLAELASSTTPKLTRYDVLARAAADLTNDLLHRGHSRGYLHTWLLSSVIFKKNSSSYLDNFRDAPGLDHASAGDYQVLFRTFATSSVADTEAIRFVKTLPPEFHPPSESPLRTSSDRWFAVVSVSNCLDWRAAVELARSRLRRYLLSPRLEKQKFDRTVTYCAAVRRLPDGQDNYLPEERELIERSVTNAARLYDTPRGKRHEGTFDELDRVLYWYEQSRQWDDLGRLIALWTALEFLFSRPGRHAAQTVSAFLIPYLVPQYGRLLLLDFQRYLGKLRLPWPDTLLQTLDATLEGGRYRSRNLDALLSVCCLEDAGHPLEPVIAEYPILQRKRRRIYRLKHPFKLNSSTHPEVYSDIERFERDLQYDLMFAYRARNAIVHDAAIDVIQMDRLVQRLNWMLCTAVDTILYQFSHNPQRSLWELHEANWGSYQLWKHALKDSKTRVLPKQILMPICYGMAGPG